MFGEKLRRRLASHHGFAAFVAALSFILASALSLFPDEIKADSRRFLEMAASLRFGPPSLWVVIFWFLVLVLAVAVYERFKTERYHQGEQVQTILRAVHRSPDPRLFVEYPDTIFREASQEISRCGDLRAPPDFATTAACIRGVLSSIIRLAEYFHPSGPPRLGANVMLVVSPAEGDDIFPPAILSRLRFFDQSASRLDSLAGVLYLPNDLVVSAQAGGRPRSIPLIALPVPKTTRHPETGHLIVLPGAPFALREGKQSMHEYTSAIAEEWCQGFDAATRAEVARYFSEAGEGRDVKSFVSWRLGTEQDPVGVLNLDSDRPYVLGSEAEYYVTFYALVSPILQLLIEPVRRYAKLGFEEGRLFGESP